MRSITSTVNRSGRRPREHAFVSVWPGDWMSVVPPLGCQRSGDWTSAIRRRAPWRRVPRRRPCFRSTADGAVSTRTVTRSHDEAGGAPRVLSALVLPHGTACRSRDDAWMERVERWCAFCATMVTPYRPRRKWPPWERRTDSCCPSCRNPVSIGADLRQNIVDWGSADDDSSQAVSPVPASDWTRVPPERVARWRRQDRARLDRARAAAGRPLGRDASAELALELRRLADLHAAGALSDEELVAAMRVALADDTR